MSKSAHVVVVAVCFVAFASVSAVGQTLPAPVLSAPVKANGVRLFAASGNCDDLPWFFPLAKVTNDECIRDFYNSSNINPIGQVRFLYGFGEGSKALSAELIPLLFKTGLRLSFGTTVTSGGNGKSSGAPGNTSTRDETIAQIKNGGDFFINAVYPVVAVANKDRTAAFYVIGDARFGFTFANLGSEATITDTTQNQFQVYGEAYGQFASLPITGETTGYIFADYKVGKLHVGQDVATALGLTDTTYTTNEIAVGVHFNGFVRVSFQRYLGNPAIYNLSASEASRWHFVLELAPKTSK